MTNGDYSAAIAHAERARADYLEAGQVRAAARIQVDAGEALRRWGRHAEARERFTAALEVLRADPDADTVRALDQLAVVNIFADPPDADSHSAEALILGQAIGIDDEQFSDLILTRAIYLSSAGRRRESIAYLREAARLATESGDNFHLGRVLLNLADTLSVTDPAAAAQAAQTAVGHLRRVGARDYLAVAVMNLIEALLQTGGWDAAEAELSQAVDADGLGDLEYLKCYRGWLAALRGDAATAEDMLGQLSDQRASEDPQDQAQISIVEAFTAVARREPQSALRHARSTLGHASSLGISHEYMRWAWPLATRSAHDLGDTSASHELRALLDSFPPGHLTPMQRAERDLARARLAAGDGDQAADEAFAAAISRLRSGNRPYHLAHGLVDHAQHLTRGGDDAAAAVALAEAGDIARRLRCQPLLDRIAELAPARPRIEA